MKGQAWKARRKIKREERVINEEREREGIKKKKKKSISVVPF